jgi:hypothetical protein
MHLKSTQINKAYSMCILSTVHQQRVSPSPFERRVVYRDAINELLYQFMLLQLERHSCSPRHRKRKSLKFKNTSVYSLSIASSILSAKVNDGSSSPAGSSGFSLMRIALISPFTICIACRLQRPKRPLPRGPS